MKRSTYFLSMLIRLVVMLAVFAPAMPTSAASHAAEPPFPSLVFVNETGFRIYELYISPSDYLDPGTDILGLQTLPDGESFFVDLSPYSRQHRVTAEALNFRSSPGSHSAANIITSLPRGQVVTVLGVSGNRGWQHVATLFRGVYREGFVAGRYLAPVRTTFDIQAVDEEGDTYQLWDVDLSGCNAIRLKIEHLDKGLDVNDVDCALPVVVEGISVINHTGSDGYRLEMTPTYVYGWGDDKLGWAILSSGESFYVDLRSYGYRGTCFDIRMTDENGRTYTLRDVDLAHRPSITITPDLASNE